MEQTMLIAVLIAALVGLFLFDTVRLRRMQVQRDAAKEEVAEVKTEFLSRISHEIKTPMNVIVGATALGLEETEHPERMEECLNRIRGASEFLMGLLNDLVLCIQVNLIVDKRSVLNDLVDMSKIENGKFHLHPKPYSFTEFLNEVENMMEPMCERKWIRFHMPHEEININMMVDPVRFFQIFFNLLSNAVKFTPEGGEVTFRICNYATHNNQFCADYVVSDNGMGMSEEFQQILFQPFTQESVNQGEPGNGAGLGLAIVRSIVDLMGGTITVKSEPQKGTEIKVHLEIEIAEIQPEIEVAHRSAEEIQNILRGKRVLLVEDHPLDVEISRRILEHVAVNVISAQDGKAALEQFKAEEPYHFDAILMDIQMPNMNGFVAARAIRKVAKPDAQIIPIIALSADDTLEDVRKCKEAGMNAHIAKPVEPQKLYQILCEYLLAPI